MLPRHIALIPDGNRRWAKSKKLNPSDGHRTGVQNFRDIVRELFKTVPHVTFWAASEDNLRKRSSLEVAILSRLIEKELLWWMNAPELKEYDIRVRVVGRWSALLKNKKLDRTVQAIEQKTTEHNKRFLTILLGYDGKREMLEAIKTLQKNNNSATDTSLKQELWTGFLPDVDLVIRTGGEPHWSAGFMMWHTANSQFYFTETLWPAFSKKELAAALQEYERRERRLGK